MSIPKQITFIEDMPGILRETVRDFCGPVISTLGPGGRTVIIANDDDSLPHVTKDGVTVAESIFFRDPRKQALASLIKEAARKTASAVGDGTTTSIVLTQELILRGLERLETVKSRKEFFEGFDLAFEKIIDYLTESSISISKDSELLEAVVKISTNGDERVCKTIMSALKDAGPDGLVNVELHDEFLTSVDIRGGSSLESTTYIPNGKRWEANDNVGLVLVAGAIKDVYEIKHVLEKISLSRTPTIIIAKEFSDAVINAVSVNNVNKKIDVALVESEGFARNLRMDILEDLAVIFDEIIYNTDGSTEHGLAEFVQTGSINLSKAIITPSETILFRRSDVLYEEAARRYTALKAEYETVTRSDSVVDAGSLRHLQKRMAKYNVVATIKVGAATKGEAKEIKDRIDDALCAISAAVNGGITPGGGAALYKASEIFSREMPETLSEDAKSGYKLMTQSCKAPFTILASNAGLVISKSDLEALQPDEVYDFRDFEVVNYLDGGIVDPTLVPVSALTNSSSVAKTILKSNSIISEWQEE